MGNIERAALQTIFDTQNTRWILPRNLLRDGVTREIQWTPFSRKFDLFSIFAKYLKWNGSLFYTTQYPAVVGALLNEWNNHGVNNLLSIFFKNWNCIFFSFSLCYLKCNNFFFYHIKIHSDSHHINDLFNFVQNGKIIEIQLDFNATVVWNEFLSLKFHSFIAFNFDLDKLTFYQIDILRTHIAHTLQWLFPNCNNLYDWPKVEKNTRNGRRQMYAKQLRKKKILCEQKQIG